ncbi:hypothetical protein DL93DRAFT_2170428 [Clavulina sp. PMI_390]|nr:hypothetical protein DL93DRAFT_2170428 [Clavulina sp. PMI_390]
MSTKRVCTEERYEIARQGPPINESASMLGDDLMAALQNVGSRVRKNVSEGYTTSRMTTPNTSPTRPQAPHPSPSKSLHPSPIRAPVFRSAADTLHDVYSQQTSFPSYSPNPSPPRPAKRVRDQSECNEEMPHHPPRLPRSVFSSVNFDDEDLVRMSDDDDDDEMDVDAPQLPPIRPSRQIIPLKRRLSPSKGSSASYLPIASSVGIPQF